MDASEGQAQPPAGRGRGAGALVIALVVAVAVLAIFWGKGRLAPQLTPTLEHRASFGGRNADACLACHRPGGPARARPAGHTPRHDCWNCHFPQGP
jgi:hypothetical protein